MSILTLIIKREFIAKVRNKSFIVMTFLSPLLIVAMSVLIGYLAHMNEGNVKQIAVHDASGFFKGDFKNTKEIAYHDVSSSSLESIKDSVAKEKYEGVIYVPKSSDVKALAKNIQYISNDSPSLSFIGSVEHIVEEKLTRINFANSGLDYDLVEKTRADVNIGLSKISGEESIKGLNEIKLAIGVFFGYLIMMFIIIYGNMVMRSVIEEKTNRIIEIIISSVKPFQLMMGKIIGTSLAGILQFTIWAIVGFVLLIGLSTFFGIQPGQTALVQPEMMDAAKEGMNSTAQMYLAELWNLPIATILVAFLIYFIGGYFLYSSFYAAIGAAVDSETDTQQFLLPILLPLMLAVYVGFLTVLNDPHGTIATVFSIVPLTSPIVMMMRIPFRVPWWQLALSITLLFGTFFAVVWFAAKIYRIGILMYGKKPTYKELFKWLKY
ncbi:ABC transporter permease [Flavobacterium sp. '19STA2R22 D10 B1']|uniref:ABC transporter permease n=1 Tax=Flavobacterium aerium TaxID=3037261 RepID=UPI00278BD52F|nr:ABC transporter permease [Flavobacterium sp. '19STA2R22 D10 B1']